MLAPIVFWIFMYILTGYIINLILSLWESGPNDSDYFQDTVKKIEFKVMLLCPVAFIQYAIRSWKNIKESD